MKKDALIERVASIQALISRKTPYSEVRSEDQNALLSCVVSYTTPNREILTSTE